MFDFAYPSLLYLLLLVPAVGLLYMWARISRRARLRRFGRPERVAQLMPDASRYTPAVKIVLQLIALAAIVFMLARPRHGATQQQETASGIEVMIAFDVSNSMLASSTDRPDGIPRLDRARLLLEKLIDRLDNDKVGLIIFAGTSKVQLPLTSDFYTAKMYLNELSPRQITYQGTDISTAIKMAMNGFSPAEDMRKAIILITDAEDHEGEALATARLAAENGIQVDVIGLGTPQGALLPGFTDAEGKPVITHLNEDLAREIAQAGDGIYVNGASPSALGDLTDQLDKLQKSEFGSVTYSAGAEQFPTFAFIAFLFMLIDFLVVERKISWLRGVNFFTRRTPAGKSASPQSASNKDNAQ
ncbi:MAG: VWA domain-containing protein [Muribaculaceae bacterium]|nr:VWA domain-containing protein [Muribaculaceae bacterium]